MWVVDRYETCEMLQVLTMNKEPDETHIYLGPETLRLTWRRDDLEYSRPAKGQYLRIKMQ